MKSRIITAIILALFMCSLFPLIRVHAERSVQTEEKNDDSGDFLLMKVGEAESKEDFSTSDTDPLELYNLRASEEKIHIEWEHNDYSENVEFEILVNDVFVDIKNDYEYDIQGLKPETEYKVTIRVLKDGYYTDEQLNRTISTLRLPTGEEVNFVDENLEKAVKASLFIENRNLRESDLDNLTELYAFDYNITSLKGLEAATNLTYVDLSDNEISDISPISNANLLEYLYLSNNNIEDISDLSALKNLKELSLWNNKVTDITPLSNLSKITYLDLDDNQIKSIETISQLTALVNLYLSNNPIKDIAPLKKLVSIESIFIYRSDIDLSIASSNAAVIRSLLELGVHVSYTTGKINTEFVSDKGVGLGWTSNVEEVESYSIEIYLEDEYGYENVFKTEINKKSFLYTGLESNKSYVINVIGIKNDSEVSYLTYDFKTNNDSMSGWLELGEDWYYLANSGEMETGWIKESGKWYYLANSGEMETGWIKESGK